MSSVINVVFDQALIDFCARTREKFSDHFDVLKSQEWEWRFVIDHQAMIRDHIILYQTDITLSNGLKLTNQSWQSYPTLFAIYMCIIADLSSCESCDDALHQTDRLQCNEIYHPISSPTGTGSNCVCSHSCMAENLYAITNQITGLTSIVGCDCIEKNELIEREVLKMAKKRTRQAIKKEKETIARGIELVLLKRMFNALKRKCPACLKLVGHLKPRYSKTNKDCAACFNKMYNKSWKSLR